MFEEEDIELVKCPFCGDSGDSGNCPHLLLLLDLTFATCDGGEAYDQFNEFGTIIEGAFYDQLEKGRAETTSWNDDGIDKLWIEAFDQYVHDGSEEFILNSCVEIANDFLFESDVIHIPAKFEGGPGMSSTLSLFYSENHAAAFAEVISKLKTIIYDATRELTEDDGFQTPNGNEADEYCPVCRRLNAPGADDTCIHYLGCNSGGEAIWTSSSYNLYLEAWESLSNLVTQILESNPEILDNYPLPSYMGEIDGDINLFNPEYCSSKDAAFELIDIKDGPFFVTYGMPSDSGKSMYIRDVDDVHKLISNMKKLEIELYSEISSGNVIPIR